MSDIWSNALRAMQGRVNAQTYDLWLRPIRLLELGEQTLRLAAPNRFMKEWFEAHFLGAVLDEIGQLRPGGVADLEVNVEIAEQGSSAPLEQAPSAGSKQAPNHPGEREDPSEPASTQLTLVTKSDAPASNAAGAGDFELEQVPGQPEPGDSNLPITQLQRVSGQELAAAQARRPDAPQHRDSTMVAGPRPEPARFHPRYDLSTFVQGACNELAASAAIAAAERPGTRYNPLFIYGDVGLGKTHLLQGIGRAISRLHPELVLTYLSAEQFMNEFVTAVRRSQFDEFRARYRQGPDCLLIDDIQFIAGRDRTMDEFFHVFNALYESGKQIVVTADRTPSEMQGMEDRVISRLNWGLVTDVQRPGIETRMAIIDQFLERDRIDIPITCRNLIAEAIDTNIRELEGALLRVAATAELRRIAINEDLVRHVLGDALERAQPEELGIDEIMKATCAYFALRMADLKGPRRQRTIARPRMIAMYLCRELTDASFPEIGMRFGGRDHSTVINAHKRIRQLADADSDVSAAISSLSSQLMRRSEPKATKRFANGQPLPGIASPLLRN